LTAVARGNYGRRVASLTRLAVFVLVLLTLPARATASTTIDVRGTWDCTSTAGGTCQYTITSEDLASGAFSGTGAGNGYTWKVNGTLTGDQLAMDMPYDGIAYHPYFDGTVSADGNTMSGHSGTAGPCASNPCPTPYTYTRTSGGGGGGGGGGAAENSQVQVTCGFRVDLSRHRCTVVVTGNATPPGGVVTFSASGGPGSFVGSPTCSLVVKTPTPTSSSCSADFHQGSEATTITASYAGDAQHNPGSGSDSLAASIGPFKTVCVSLWVGDCTGFLPAPDPLRVCVSAWEDCTGFGGSKPAKPGTIDMSGFPAKLDTPVTCTGRTRKLADNAPSGSGTCSIEEYLSNTASTRTQADDKAQYVQNQRLFASEADSSAAQIKSGITSACLNVQADVNAAGEAPCRVIIAYNIVLTDGIDQLFREAKAPGEPVTHIVDVGKVDGCLTIVADEARRFCIDLVTSTNDVVTRALEQLKALKHKLGVDAPFAKARKSDLRAHAARAPKHRVRGLRVLGFGHTRVRVGKTGHLRIKLPAWVRTDLRRARRAGRRSLKVKLVIQASPRAGLVYTRTKTLRLVLRR
jgi:hypothetical protein